jgi:hypothetical protein
MVQHHHGPFNTTAGRKGVPPVDYTPLADELRRNMAREAAAKRADAAAQAGSGRRLRAQSQSQSQRKPSTLVANHKHVPGNPAAPPSAAADHVHPNAVPMETIWDLYRQAERRRLE